MLTKEEIEQNKQEFLTLCRTLIKRDGIEEFLKWLEKSDFFSAPASTRFHMSCDGGLCAHSLLVYKRLKKKMECEELFSANEETLAIIGLLHDVCKTEYYKVDKKNVKKNGQWQEEPYYSVEDKLPYGHGEKSVYILSGFIKLSREEAMAINWHMGWSDVRAIMGAGSMSLAAAYRKFPLALLLFTADAESTYIDENSELTRNIKP